MGNRWWVAVLIGVPLLACSCGGRPEATPHHGVSTPASVTAGVPAHNTSVPLPVVRAAENAGVWDGDRHPRLPVEWVLTTDRAASSIMSGELPSVFSMYLVQIRGHFPSCRPCTGLLPQPPGTVIVLTIPVDDGPGHDSGFSFGNRVHDLSTLGPVHTFRLSASLRSS